MIIDMNEAPPLESNHIYYNCSECSSIIEILSINENNIDINVIIIIIIKI